MITWSGAWRLPLGDSLGILLLYEVIGAVAMIILGTPLFWIYKKLGWTGWVPFMLGGGICATVTSALFLFTSHQFSQVPFFTVLGIGCGFVFRLVLYGIPLESRLGS